MISESIITSYLVLEDDPVEVALRKLSINQSRVVFVVSHDGTLVGSLSDGDFRRWILESPDHNLSSHCGNIANRQCVFVKQNEQAPEENSIFSSKILIVPIVDDLRRVVAVGKPRSKAFSIGGRLVGQSEPVLVIAEIGLNHNGSLNSAFKLIDLALDSGADAVKFQMRDMDSLYRDSHESKNGEDLGVEYTLDLINKATLSSGELIEAFEYAQSRNILPLCTPWDEISAKTLQEWGISGFKVASADLTNHSLISMLASTGTPLLVSTGMSTEHEIVEAANLLKSGFSPYALLHCNSTYPAPFNDIRLEYMSRLAEIGDCLIGYSGHERGHHVAIAAVALGAKIVEKHITLNREAIGNDHKVSLEPNEFKQMVQEIRQVEASLKYEGPRNVTQGEKMNRLTLAKSLVAKNDLQFGHVIRDSDIEIKSPGRGLQPNSKTRLIGAVLTRSMKKADFFYESDINAQNIKKREFQFNRPWGIPVRFHDFGKLSENTNPDFLEFHLSYRDLEIDIESFINQKINTDLVVHSPDLFANDFILDLAASDKHTYIESRVELQRVINFTRNLSRFFKPTEKVKIVVSMGGSSLNSPIPIENRPSCYERVAEAIGALDSTDVELTAQTLPPYPWYLGGQRYCNLFIDPIETARFSEMTDIPICLDISHTKLACNDAGSSFYSAIEILAPYVKHLHLVDAIGSNEEGVQIGEGEVDWPSLSEQLNRNYSGIGFIPEIWQGHVDDGHGFWVALERLEKLLA
jgi:sialic acid synthase SpsE/sugar phosphate isomerase/epimerase/CBS domain-containing protein